VLATIEAGIASDGKSFTFHELRHTAAAFMIDEGGDPLQVMRRMGHSDIRTTYSLYGHLFPDREGRAGEQVRSTLPKGLGGL
jgi:integrase